MLKLRNLKTALSVDNGSPSSHNLSYSTSLKMEEDCADHHVTKSETTPPTMDIAALFNTFTLRISDLIIQHTNVLRDEIRDKEVKMHQDNEDFKLEVRYEITEIRHLLQALPSLSTSTTSTSTSLVPNVPSVSPSPSPASGHQSMSSIPLNTSVPVSSDLQAQMMYMMAESFSKLSTVLVENKQESKVYWPKFAGDSKKFRNWYLSVMTQISLPPWSTL
jgi:CCR4-NOT transcriptional regulation complex NOT5 subunit